MLTARVMEVADVLEDGGLGLTADLPRATPDQLGLDGRAEGLDGSVIPAVSRAAYRRRQAMIVQDLLVVVRTVSVAARFACGRCSP